MFVTFTDRHPPNSHPMFASDVYFSLFFRSASHNEPRCNEPPLPVSATRAASFRSPTDCSDRMDSPPFYFARKLRAAASLPNIHSMVMVMG
ncbi:hypothetical protein CEXT_400441 [Caerostris extrusa]|uniref:Uncharacterized protein n=1 Tax=Caerostris extrusa TaxID=172846 RepID=A0AAV4QA41_CAEEX|nr:hypothetical protein CEXT_400441 [Caerostris extrusa]